MIRKHVFKLVLLLSLNAGMSQNLKKLDSIKPIELIDTLLIDRDINNWSLRLISIFKEQRLKLKDNENTLNFVPNNRVGIGIGFATRKLILDISFPIKNKKKDPTQRFDLKGLYFYKHHFFNFFIQDYKGFNITNNFDQPEVFREDIGSFSLGIDYLYFPNSGEFSFGALKSGLFKQKKTVHSFGLGGFMVMNKVRTSKTVIPVGSQSLFNNEALLNEYKGTSLGVMGGFATIIVLPYDFFVFFYVAPGIGLSDKSINSEDGSYRPKNPLIYRLGFFGGLGYNGKHFYVNLTAGRNIYATDLDFGNRGAIRITNAKLSIGYKLGK